MNDSFLDAVESKSSGAPAFSREGLDLVRTFEGFRPDAYYDLGGNKGTLTVGYGFTKSDIPDLKPGYKIDQRRAEQMLPSLLNKKYGPTVLRNVKVPLTDEQYSALTSFVYNVGPGAFEKSTLLKKLNGGDFEGAASEFDRWVFAGGKPVDGLAKRRAAEKALFTNDIQTLGSILENQRFGFEDQKKQPKQTKEETFSDIIEKKAKKLSREDAEQLLPASLGGEKVSKAEAEKLLPASLGGEKVSKQEAMQELAGSNYWKSMEERLKQETSKLAEPPSIDGTPKPEVASAPIDPFAELPKTEVAGEETKSKTSTVNALLKMAGKKPIDLSGAGKDMKVDFTFKPGELFAGIGQGFMNYFSKGGAITPMPDNPEGQEQKETEVPAGSFAQSVDIAGTRLNTDYSKVQSGLARTSGLAPQRRS